MGAGAPGRGGISLAVAVLAVLMAAFQLLSTQFLFLSYLPYLNLHLAFGMSIVFLQAAEKGTRGRALLLLAFLAGLLVTGYIHLEADVLPDREQAPTALDTLLGVLLIVLVIWGAHLSFGPTLPVLALVGIAYGFLGPYVPDPFFHAGVDFVRLVAMLTTDLGGIYGTLLSISATYMALFLILGSFIENSGAARFFIDFPLALFRGVRAGGAYAAVVASALFGMGSGSPTANVVTTGTFTIPLMKRQGFLPHVAGAVEAAASTGGQIMPPVMGAVAFVMAEFTGVPYSKIIGYAAIPALLYFLTIGFGIYFRAEVRGLKALPAEGLPELREVVFGLKYLLPIAVLIWVLVAGYTPSLAAFWAIAALAAVNLPRRPGAAFGRMMGTCFEQGARRAAEFALAMACISIFVKVIMATGVGLKLPLLVVEYSGGSLLFAYLLTAFALAVIGMEVPTVPAYILVAVLAVPALTELGANPLQAHFFALYFSVLSALTPPVALAALAASKVAEADYFKTAWWSMKFGYVAFIIPFLFAYNPALMALAPPGEVVLAAVGTFLGCTATSACLQGYFLERTTPLDRLLLAAAALGFFAFVVRPQLAPFAAAAACVVAAALRQRGLAGLGLRPWGARAARPAGRPNPPGP